MQLEGAISYFEAQLSMAIELSKGDLDLIEPLFFRQLRRQKYVQRPGAKSNPATPILFCSHLQPILAGSTPSTAVAPYLRSRLCYRIAIQCDRSLGEQSAIRRGPSSQLDRCRRKNNSLKVSGGSDRHISKRLPEDVLGTCAARKDHVCSGRLGDSSGRLKNPYVVSAPLKSYAR